MSAGLASLALTVKVCGAALLIRTLQFFSAALASAADRVCAFCGAGAVSCLAKIAAGEIIKTRMKQETAVERRRLEKLSDINAGHFLL
ncbi:MAG: hypothetical protein DMF67_00715 [Acidobacteria bacterium]|nr:MAG: hypothetical protein DMF66_04075 [Acidobacteriota bacterium]PYS85506.1 MAG: hypothetical protein DMF67_00715 [Acidobacteriota bacterium]